MNGLMNKNQLTVVKESINKIDSILDNCCRDCYKKHFHTFEYKCVYNIKFTNIGNKDTVNLTFSDKNMSSYELNRKLRKTRQRGFIFNQINKLTIKISTNISNTSFQYYLKLRIPIKPRQFLK